MLLNQKLGSWGATHHPAWLDVLRMGVGLFLCLKGIAFLTDIWGLQRLLTNINLNWASLYLAQIISFTHLIGGLLIALGLFTRMAIFFQIPILIGAVLFNWPGLNLTSLNPMVPGGVQFVWPGLESSALTLEWWSALLTLVVLIFCWFLNSGPWSVDHYLQKYEES